MKIKDTCFYEVKWTEEQTRMEEDTQSSVSSAGGEKTWDSPRNWQYQVPGGRNITVVWELVMKTCCWAADCWRKICTPCFPYPTSANGELRFWETELVRLSLGAARGGVQRTTERTAQATRHPPLIPKHQQPRSSTSFQTGTDCRTFFGETKPPQEEFLPKSCLLVPYSEAQKEPSQLFSYHSSLETLKVGVGRQLKQAPSGERTYGSLEVTVLRWHTIWGRGRRKHLEISKNFKKD